MNAAEVAKRWASGMVAAVPKIKAGVMAVTVSPATKAIAAKDKYVAGIMQSLEDGTWEAGLRSVDFNDWKEKTANAGTTRIQSGVSAATPGFTKFLEQLLPYTESVSRQIAQMPDNTAEDRIARMVANARLMAQFKPRT